MEDFREVIVATAGSIPGSLTTLAAAIAAKKGRFGAGNLDGGSL